MTQELTKPELLKLFQTTKAEREAFVSELIETINNGLVNPLEIHLQIKCMEDVVKLTTGNTVYKKLVTETAETYGEKTFQFHNAKMEIKETGVKYDFSQCADPVLVSLYQRQAEIDKAVKDREAMLKTVSQKGMIITDEATGETFTVYPPSKSSSTSLAVTLK